MTMRLLSQILILAVRLNTTDWYETVGFDVPSSAKTGPAGVRPIGSTLGQLRGAASRPTRPRVTRRPTARPCPPPRGTLRNVGERSAPHRGRGSPFLPIRSAATGDHVVTGISGFRPAGVALSHNGPQDPPTPSAVDASSGESATPWQGGERVANRNRGERLPGEVLAPATKGRLAPATAPCWSFSGEVGSASPRPWRCAPSTSTRRPAWSASAAAKAAGRATWGSTRRPSRPSTPGRGGGAPWALAAERPCSARFAEAHWTRATAGTW